MQGSNPHLLVQADSLPGAPLRKASNIFNSHHRLKETRNQELERKETWQRNKKEKRERKILNGG